jgi:RNA polymerase sigma-70 factor (ECF subfamily)
MSERDTNLGGLQRAFPETTAGLTAPLGLPGSPGHLESLAKIGQRYWKPVYGYIRVAWHKSNEDAKDLTQAFFLWLLEGEVLEGFDPVRGSFRGYLKVLLRRFVGHEEAALRRLKRGGGVDTLSLDEAGSFFESVLSDPRQEDPERVFEKLWLVDRLHQALTRVRERCLKGARAIQFEIYEKYDLVSQTQRPTYKDLARALGLEETQIKNHLFAIREEIRREVLAELELGSRGDERLSEAWNALFGS